MNVGELFVNLGIKGSEKTIGAIGGVKNALGGVADMSLEAKAGILAAMYALERMFAASGAAGTNLTNFTALTGKSNQELQRWQYAARQAGVSNEEFAGSFKAVQNVMSDMLLGKGAPEGMAMLANQVGFDPKRARDTMYVLEQLQKFAQTVPADVGNRMMKSFGLSEGTMAAMRRNAFTPDVMAKAPIYKEDEIQSLDRANIAWSNLGTKIEMAVGHFNAKHGVQIVQDITKITDAVLKLAEALIKVAEQYKIFAALAKIANVTAELLDPKPGTWMAEKHGEEKIAGAVMDWMKGLAVKGDRMLEPVAQSIAPSVPKMIGPPTQQQVEINQTLQFQHDGKDHQKNSESHKKAIKDAYRQIQSQVQGS